MLWLWLWLWLFDMNTVTARDTAMATAEATATAVTTTATTVTVVSVFCLPCTDHAVDRGLVPYEAPLDGPGLGVESPDYGVTAGRPYWGGTATAKIWSDWGKIQVSVTLGAEDKLPVLDGDQHGAYKLGYLRLIALNAPAAGGCIVATRSAESALRESADVARDSLTDARMELHGDDGALVALVLPRTVTELGDPALGAAVSRAGVHQTVHHQDTDHGVCVPVHRLDDGGDGDGDDDDAAGD